MADGGTSDLHRIPAKNGGWLRTQPKGVSGNPAGMSKERKELLSAIESNCIPRVLKVLDVLEGRALAGDTIAARLWLDQVRGPLKPRDNDDIERAVEEKLLELIQQERARRAQETK